MDNNWGIPEQEQTEQKQTEGKTERTGETESPLAREEAAGAEEPMNESENRGEEKPSGCSGAEDEIARLKQALEQKEKAMNDLLDQAKRLAAEYDNYRKRTAREKERLYDNSVCDVVARFLPVVDNLERATATEVKTDEGKNLLNGLSMILRQVSDILDKLGVKPIECVGKTFDPQFHNAVMHIEDEKYGAGEIVEEFQKGYIYKDETVIRHSMVKVAN
jgi:GrpE.